MSKKKSSAGSRSKTAKKRADSESPKPTTSRAKPSPPIAKAVDAELVDASPFALTEDVENNQDDPTLDRVQRLEPIELGEGTSPLDELAGDLGEELTDPMNAGAASGRFQLRPGAETVTTSTAVATADPVSVYLAELRKYPVLTREQELELAVRYRETGDPKAAEQLVTGNLRFVVKVAAEYTRFGARLIDLIQEGNVGLMQAVREFNPYKGTRLITYAVWWIRGYIQDYLMRQHSMVRIGTTQNQRKLFYRLQKEKDRLINMGQQPTVALLSDRLGVTSEEVEEMSQRMASRDLSLNQPLDGDSKATWLDQEADPQTPVDESIGQRELLDMLAENLDRLRPTLNEKETYLLENRLLEDPPLTLQEVGDHFGVTREAVRQMEVRLLQKLRKLFDSALD